jgi:DNA helicase-2/ATP-dependent DNA helicase PcrA
MPCTLCPNGYRDPLPCPQCDCGIRSIPPDPAPPCGGESFVPCMRCTEGCPYYERACDLANARYSRRWWDGQDYDNPWGDPPGEEPEVNDIFDGLNDQQWQAVEHLDGPCLLTAGAGSGKTRTLTARVVYLKQYHGVHPAMVLCVTFTRKAAQELQGRAAEALGQEDAKHLTCSTFHSLALKICRENPEAIGRERGFSVWDDKTMTSQIRRLWKEEVAAQPPEERDKLKRLRADTDAMLGALYASKDRGLDPKTDEQLKQVLDGMDGPCWAVVMAYEDLKATCNALDFADLIWAATLGMERDSWTRKRVQSKWRYVMVDEYQDSSLIQARFVRMLAEEHQNLMVVGDDDQSIYQWRGAEPENLIQFDKRWPGTTVVHLGQNYRSTQRIVNFAASVIENNVRRREKKIWSEGEAGVQIVVDSCFDEWVEARRVVKGILSAIEDGAEPSDCAVLARTRRQISRIQVVAAELDLPMVAVGVIDWWQRADVRLVLSWLKLLLNGGDLDAGAYVMSSWPGVGPKTVQSWRKTALNYDGHCFQRPMMVLQGSPGFSATSKRGKCLRGLTDLYGKLRGFMGRGLPLSQLIGAIYDDGGIQADIDADRDETGSTAADSVFRDSVREMLMTVAEEIREEGEEGVEELLDRIALNSKIRDRETDAATVSTIHSSKGLEWDRVWVLGCVYGALPLSRVDSRGTVERLDSESLESERRLFYVAATRAKRHLHLSVPMRLVRPGSEPIHTSLSPFVSEGLESDREIL